MPADLVHVGWLIMNDDRVAKARWLSGLEISHLRHGGVTVVVQGEPRYPDLAQFSQASPLGPLVRT